MSKMQIAVTTSTRSITHSLAVDATDTVRSVMVKIHELQGLPLSSQSLQLAGKSIEMFPGHTLEQLHVNVDSTVRVSRATRAQAVDQSVPRVSLQGHTAEGDSVAVAPAVTAIEVTCARCGYDNESDGTAGAECEACGTPLPRMAARGTVNAAPLNVRAVLTELQRHALDRAGAEVRSTLHAHGDPLRHVTSINHWRCHGCSLYKTARDVRYRCGVCVDFDVCVECFSTAGPSVSPVPGMCRQRHPLQKVKFTPDGTWYCHHCTAPWTVTDVKMRRFRCYGCHDFDLCGLCVAETLLTSGEPDLETGYESLGTGMSGLSVSASGSTGRCSGAGGASAPGEDNTVVPIQQGHVASTNAVESQGRHGPCDGEQSHPHIIVAELEASAPCVVCTVRPRPYALVPCGHRCVCSECACKVDACPQCQQEVTMAMRVCDDT